MCDLVHDLKRVYILLIEYGNPFKNMSGKWKTENCGFLSITSIW